MAAPQRWMIRHEGSEHVVEISESALARGIVWTVDGTPVAENRSWDDRPVLDGKEHGAVLVRLPALTGPARRVTWWGPDTRPAAVAAATAGMGGLDLDPESGSEAAAREEWIRAHPTQFALRRTAVATAKVGIPILIAWLLARYALPAIPWPEIRWPSIPWPSIPWPSIPWPDIPWPSIPWPSIHWPSIHWPDWRLPGLPAWLEPIRRYAPLIVPIVVAVVVARREVTRRRRQDELKRRLRASVPGDDRRPDASHEDDGASEPPRERGEVTS